MTSNLDEIRSKVNPRDLEQDKSSDIEQINIILIKYEADNANNQIKSKICENIYM